MTIERCLVVFQSFDNICKQRNYHGLYTIDSNNRTIRFISMLDTETGKRFRTFKFGTTVYILISHIEQLHEFLRLYNDQLSNIDDSQIESREGYYPMLRYYSPDSGSLFIEPLERLIKECRDEIIEIQEGRASECDGITVQTLEHTISQLTNILNDEA